jgi:hypothetical protein
MGKMVPRSRPCPSCPYRQDVPSGIWAAGEYDKLPLYDGTTIEQAMSGALGIFACHSAPGKLCAGWAGCHDMDENLAIRMHASEVDVDATCAYISPVPLFSTGAEAAAHGKRDIEAPSQAARRKSRQLLRVIGRRRTA